MEALQLASSSSNGGQRRQRDREPQERATAATSEIVNIDHSSMYGANSSLYLNPKFSDVDILIEDTTFPVHKLVLASRSKYFEGLLLSGMKESKESVVKINDVTAAAFEVILKYVYTGKMTLDGLDDDAIVDIIGLCHQWGFEEALTSICDYMKEKVEMGNVSVLMNSAVLLDLDALAETCYTFADAYADKLLDDPSFLQLTLDAVTKLTSRDSCPLSEDQIMKALCNWVRHNQKTYVNAASVLDNVRLSLLDSKTKDKLLESYRAARLFKPDIIENALTRDDRNVEARGLVVLPEENVAHVKHGATVIHGEKPEALLNGDTKNYSESSGFTHCPISTNENEGKGIVVELKQYCVLNHIRLLLLDADKNQNTDYRIISNARITYSYYIEVSTDKKKWEKICDHSDYPCCSWQNIFFTKRTVKYIRIVGTQSTVNQLLQIVALEAYLTKNKYNLHPELGLLVPKENVAALTHGARVIKCGGGGDALINGICLSDNYGNTYHEIGSGGIIVQLAQPYVLNSMRLRLYDRPDIIRYDFKYYIEVSVNLEEWHKVWDKSGENCTSWQNISFEPRPVVYIRLVGTSSAYIQSPWNGSNGTDSYLCCIHLECPAQT